ncbi:Uncharacterized protein SCF082_LOCUS2998 [Durusdinium trenchii]|uniref:Alpha-1,4-N-acetylglucosaminyltransferase n=1 Tax=Durusdinium trenchii TaxID=1381693 RepID=A0ABP0HQX7_9DINO
MASFREGKLFRAALEAEEAAVGQCLEEIVRADVRHHMRDELMPPRPGRSEPLAAELPATARVVPCECGEGRKLREFSVVVALATLILVAFCIFFVQVENDLQPVASPPFRFSVKLARLRAKPKETRIPQQLVLTSKDGSINSLPVAVQRNVRHTMALNPWVKVRFLGDQDCERYLLQHFNHTQLPLFFNQETRGSYRSDVCRAAVLAREGGFYTDLDVEMKWKFEDLAGNATTFLASWTEDGSVLNAMMGCTANSSFMLEVIEQLLRFYKGEPVERYGSTSEWMGPVTALAGLKMMNIVHITVDINLDTISV